MCHFDRLNRGFKNTENIIFYLLNKQIKIVDLFDLKKNIVSVYDNKVGSSRL